MSAQPTTASPEANNLVGPVLRSCELAHTVIEAIREDNPDRDIGVVDKRAYLRVQAEQDCIVRRATVERLLGRPFQMQEIEPLLSSFAGQIETTTDHVRFYYARSV